VTLRITLGHIDEYDDRVAAFARQLDTGRGGAKVTSFDLARAGDGIRGRAHAIGYLQGVLNGLGIS
jgi:hypothetical protein